MVKYLLIDSNDNEYGIFETVDKAFNRIKEYLESINFKIYYYRQTILENNSIWIDYGSHTHFFYIVELTHDE